MILQTVCILRACSWKYTHLCHGKAEQVSCPCEADVLVVSAQHTHVVLSQTKYNTGKDVSAKRVRPASGPIQSHTLSILYKQATKRLNTARLHLVYLDDPGAELGTPVLGQLRPVLVEGGVGLNLRQLRQRIPAVSESDRTEQVSPLPFPSSSMPFLWWRVAWDLSPRVWDCLVWSPDDLVGDVELEDVLEGGDLGHLLVTVDAVQHVALLVAVRRQDEEDDGALKRLLPQRRVGLNPNGAARGKGVRL